MNEKILVTLKRMLGLESDQNAFDTEITLIANGIFHDLYQMGVGTEEPFSIETGNETWNDFLENKTDLESVKPYVYLKIRVVFDPPTSATVMEAINKRISEFEWRMYAQEENKRFAES